MKRYATVSLLKSVAVVLLSLISRVKELGCILNPGSLWG